MSPTESRRAPPLVLAAMSVLAAVVMVLQIAATRILSATISYHSAFAVIALVMLGMAASSIKVFLHRAAGPVGLDRPARYLLGAGVASVVAVLGFIQLGAIDWGSFYQPVHMLAALVLFYGIFYLCGYGVSFLLARYAGDVSRVYWFDLSGAAAGCILAVVLLDAMSAFLVVLRCGLGASIAGLLLARAGGRVIRWNLVATGGVAAVVLASIAWPRLIDLRTAKEQDQSVLLWEKWNRLARVTVIPDVPAVGTALRILRETWPEVDVKALVNRWQAGWGMSERFDGEAPQILWVQLDADAGTQILRDGATRYADGLEVLEWDVTSAAHRVLGDRLGRAFVVGGGGGRDVLAALHFGAREVDVVELNPAVVEAVEERFGAFSGRPYSLPQVHLTIGEARSVLSRSEATWDLIQMSMIDTWAASMAGAMVLSENALYTSEAYDQFLRHLAEGGMFSVSRWYDADRYGEVARIVALMTGSLARAGVADPGPHLAVIYAKGHYDLNVATCIMKASPLEEAEIGRLVDLVRDEGFTLLWPEIEGVTADEPIPIARIVARDPSVVGTDRFDLAPPTDDRPFFFNIDRPVRSWWHALRARDPGLGSRASLLFSGLLGILLVAGRLLVQKPLQAYDLTLPEARRASLARHLAPATYFACIGLGFMMVEFATIQRYILFLGHPTYALSVVLFTLLLCSGIGSALSARLPTKHVRWPLVAIVLGIALTALVVPAVTERAHGWSLPLRIALSAALVAPLGLCMGTIYPLGVRILEEHDLDHLVPWVWTINGLFGVVASVLGMLVAMNRGYTVVLVLAALAYCATGWSATRSWRVRTG